MVEQAIAYAIQTLGETQRLLLQGVVEPQMWMKEVTSRLAQSFCNENP